MHISISVVTIVFVLCGGCGFNSYPSENIVIRHQANALDRKIIMVQCKPIEFCEILKSTINHKTTAVIISSDDLIIQNPYYVTITAEITSKQVMPIIYSDYGPSPFYKYSYQVDFYVNSYYVHDKKINIQDYLIVIPPTDQLRKEANAYGYQNTYLYTTESQVWNNLYEQTASGFIRKLTESIS